MFRFLKRQIGKQIMAFFVIFCIFSCQPDSSLHLEKENKKLQKELKKKDELIDVLIDFYSSIEKDLEAIAEKKWILSDIRQEKPQEKRQLNELSKKLYADLQDLRHLMQNNKDKMQAFKDRLDLRSEQTEKIQEILEVLQQSIEKKEAEIQELRHSLSGVNQEYVKVFDDYLKKTEELDSLQQKEQEKYYCLGTKKEFLKAKIIENTAQGLKMISLPNSSELSAYCRLLDRTKDRAFTVLSKKISIISHHPQGSYTILKKGEEKQIIQILSEETFWSLSDYLMVIER